MAQSFGLCIAVPWVPLLGTTMPIMYQQLSSHFTEELMEERHFGRLTETESKLFDFHARLCQPCAIKFQNERMFIFAMQAALERPEPFENRDGATFQAAACAA